ncbi:MAG: hypothetical protein KBF17_14830 [Candidatus Promineofilum sp.]|nr:hypothetical protein [Promineifilum sp.]
MSKLDRHEQKFLNALRDIFVGAKIEGESGYINLMKIKSRYYTEGVFPRLMDDIDAACRPFDPAFREELFDKLHDFFGRYFSESGSIYFRHTAFHHNVYERVYTDDRDVIWGGAGPTAPPTSGGNCDPSYPTVCIPPPPPDLDCGDIPHRRFQVVSPVPHNFDRDGDGIGCESG